MLLRIFLIVLALVLFFRFVGRLFLTMLMRSTEASKKKSRRNIDDSQIQDADFKDL